MDGLHQRKDSRINRKKKIVMGGSDAWACRSYSYGL